MKFKAERIIQIREQLGMNKAEAARKLNMSAMGYGRYENGQREPSFQTVCFIATTFNTTSDYLYGLTDDPSPSTITISPKSKISLSDSSTAGKSNMSSKPNDFKKLEHCVIIHSWSNLK